MCEFCNNIEEWNMDDYSLFFQRGLCDGVMREKQQNVYQIGTFDSPHDYWDVLDINFCPMCGRKLV